MESSESYIQSPFHPGCSQSTHGWYTLVHASANINVARNSSILLIRRCKEGRGVAHEFLLVEVSIVTGTVTFTVHLKIERMGGHANTPSSSSASLNSANSSGLSSSTNPANDKVRVYADIASMDLPSHQVGETFHFHDTKPTVAEAACLFLSVTNYAPNYNMVKKNCYWYAKVVLQLAQTKFRGRVVVGESAEDLGRLGGLPIVPPELDSDAAMHEAVAVDYDRIRTESSSFKSSLEVRRFSHSSICDLG